MNQDETAQPAHSELVTARLQQLNALLAMPGREAMVERTMALTNAQLAQSGEEGELKIENGKVIFTPLSKEAVADQDRTAQSAHSELVTARLQQLNALLKIPGKEVMVERTLALTNTQLAQSGEQGELKIDNGKVVFAPHAPDGIGQAGTQSAAPARATGADISRG
jgi:hypothetical protein